MKKMLLAMMIASCVFAPAFSGPSKRNHDAHYIFLDAQANTLLDLAQTMTDQILQGDKTKKMRENLKKVMNDIHYVLTQLILYKKQMSANRFSTLVLIIKTLKKIQQVLISLNCFQ